MGDVIELDVITTLDIPAERVLDGALEEDLANAIVLGYTEDGELYMASSMASDSENAWLIDLAKAYLIDLSLSD